MRCAFPRRRGVSTRRGAGYAVAALFALAFLPGTLLPPPHAAGRRGQPPAALRTAGPYAVDSPIGGSGGA
jgi:hypothetical protein